MAPTARCLALLPLVLLLGTAPLYAQEADTTDAPAPDTTAADPAGPGATPDTTVADTMAVDTTRQAQADSVAADTVAARSAMTASRADSLAAARADSLAALKARSKQAARAAAEQWLALTDAGAFEDSWTAADSTFQRRVDREDWVDQGRRVRARLDTMRTRRLTRTVYRDSTAQLPGRDPVVLLQYATEYDRGNTLEAVVTTRQDTTWKVAGYRIVPAPDSTAASAGAASTDEEAP